MLLVGRDGRFPYPYPTDNWSEYMDNPLIPNPLQMGSKSGIGKPKAKLKLSKPKSKSRKPKGPSLADFMHKRNKPRAV